MFASDGLPEYPPPRNAWQFPPPLVPARYRWLAVLGGVAGVVAAGAMIAVLVVMTGEDYPGIIDDPDLTDTVATQCELMTQTVESMPLGGTPEQRAATIADQNRAVEIMLEAIRSQRADEILADRPAEEWLADWEVLLDVRRLYARELLRDPNASFSVPHDADGNAITQRMEDVFLSGSPCDVPEVLTNPTAGEQSAV